MGTPRLARPANELTISDNVSTGSSGFAKGIGGCHARVTWVTGVPGGTLSSFHVLDRGDAAREQHRPLTGYLEHLRQQRVAPLHAEDVAAGLDALRDQSVCPVAHGMPCVRRRAHLMDHVDARCAQSLHDRGSEAGGEDCRIWFARQERLHVSGTRERQEQAGGDRAARSEATRALDLVAEGAGRPHPDAPESAGLCNTGGHLRAGTFARHRSLHDRQL
jgi:hypothetical protein